MGLAQDFWLDLFGHLFEDQNLENLFVSTAAFMDEVYLMASSLQHLQCMLNDLIRMLASIGLTLNPKKVKWNSNKWACLGCNAKLIIDECEVPRADTFPALGSVISGDLSEIETYNHRIACGWAVYNKWSRILESQASIADRLALWGKTVQHSFLWGLQTTRAQDKSTSLSRLAPAQKLMFRKMLKLKRRVLLPGVMEPWLDWHIRSCRKAGDVVV
jgi:hypothetical protein